MALSSHPDFRRWLASFEQRHRDLPGPVETGTICDGCGGSLADAPGTLPYCLVCLAEQYGRERAEAAAAVAATLRVALATAPEPPMPNDVRAAVQAVLDEYEAGFGPVAPDGGDG